MPRTLAWPVCTRRQGTFLISFPCSIPLPGACPEQVSWFNHGNLWWEVSSWVSYGIPRRLLLKGTRFGRRKKHLSWFSGVQRELSLGLSATQIHASERPLRSSRRHISNRCLRLPTSMITGHLEPTRTSWSYQYRQQKNPHNYQDHRIDISFFRFPKYKMFVSTSFFCPFPIFHIN